MLEKEIKAYALKNAIEYGKAEPSKVLPKLFRHGLEKKDIKKIIPIIIDISKEINSFSKKKQQTLLNFNKKFIKERDEKPGGLPELPNPMKKMVFRLAPFPSGALHIGNAKTFLLNALYAEKYGGKIILVMDDTIGSANKQLAPEAYNLIEKAFEWLGIKYNRKVYKSDRLEIYYKYAIRLIKKNKAYVCYCSVEELRKKRADGMECSCRQFPKKIQLSRWEEMFKAKEGQATLRIKTNMMHPNPAFRDRVLFKISDRPHPRTKNKYRVWPTLEMSWAIDDHLLGITHIIRGSDLQIETDMEKYIWDIFSWEHPTTIHTGLIKIEGIKAKISKSKAQKEVKSGEFSGWSDPRTWSIQSLKRRGIQSESLRQFIREIGLNKHNITLPIESLYSVNRRMIDSSANRYSFIAAPVNLRIKDKPKIKNITIHIHPNKDETRTVKVGQISISRTDFDNFKGKEIRLIHLFNMKLDNKKHEAKFTSLENKNIPKINWISSSTPCSVLMPDSSIIKGIAETSIRKIKLGEVVQFERFGFVKLDNKSPAQFWFTHK